MLNKEFLHHTDMITEASLPLLPNEKDRLAALKSYHVLDTAADKDFDDLTQMASAICQTPVALISLIDDHRQWFKSRVGVDLSETPKAYSLCAHAIAQPKHTMVVKNAKTDDRFANNPLVTGVTNVTFYAGVPLVNNDGFALGSLCVIDTQERDLSSHQIHSLTVLAKQVMDKLELKRKVQELEIANAKLADSYKSLQTAHNKIFETDNRLNHLLEQAPVAIATLKGRGLTIELANERMLQIWGKTEAVVGEPLADALPQLQDQPYLQLLDYVFATGETYYGYDAKATIKLDGWETEGFFNFVYQPLKDSEGQVESILVIASEVTEQADTRRELEESNHRLEIALGAAKLGSYELNLHTGTMDCNEQCKKNFGLAMEQDFHFANLFEAIVPEHRNYVEEQVNNAIASRSIYNAEYEIFWPDGSRHWVAASGKPIYNRLGNAVRMIGVTQNITARKMADQHKDDFLSIASHELKTPITSLKGSLQLLNHLRDPSTPSTTNRLIDVANKSIEKISKLVDQLLNFNRIDHGQLHLNKSWFSINEMLNQCCNHVRLEGKHKLVVQGEKDLKIFADEDRIDQVVVNFVNNAIKYAPGSNSILLNIVEEEGMAKVSVTDNGPGIPLVRQPHIFERYYRADHSGSNYSGLGLGLYICAEIIRKHGGKIGVDSVEGQGSTFWFTLPLAAADSLSASPLQ